MNMKEEKIRLISALEIVTGAGIILFWLAFFLAGLLPEKPDACYFSYMLSTLVPSILLALLLILAGIVLERNVQRWSFLSFIAAGAMIFMGLVSASYNVINGVYTSSLPDLVINLVANLWCVGAGLAVILMIRSGRN